MLLSNALHRAPFSSADLGNVFNTQHHPGLGAHSRKDVKIRVFPIISPHEIIAPHHGIFIMFGGAIGYLTTKLGGGYNGKDPKILVAGAITLTIITRSNN